LSSVTLADHWQYISNGADAISLVVVGDVRFDNQRAVTEIIFTLNREEKWITTDILFNQRNIPKEELKNVERQLNVSGYSEKAKYLMKLLDMSYVCMGFKIEVGEQIDIYNVPLKKQQVLSSDGIVEEIIFPPECQVLTNSGGRRCFNCEKIKKVYPKKLTRHQNNDYEEHLQPKTNHRYMSREQILEKLSEEKKRRKKEEL